MTQLVNETEGCFDGGVFDRERYIKQLDWQPLGVTGTVPTVGMEVYALYEVDQRWYRGRIEEVNNTRVSGVGTRIEISFSFVGGY